MASHSSGASIDFYSAMSAMNYLPNEMWVNIISRANKSDLVVLSRTCKFFCTIAQASLFSEVFLKLTSSPAQDASLDHRLVLFQTSITIRPELGVLVHKFSMSCSELRSMYRGWLSFVSTFSNLQSLDFDGFHVDPDFRAALHSLNLPRLRKISLRNSVIEHSMAPIGGGSPNRVSEIIIQESSFNGVSPATASAGLRQLSILHDRRSDLLSTYMSSGATHTLMTLKVPVISGTLLRFLEASPQLRHLELKLTGFRKAGTIDELSIDAIPFLESFSGPAKYATMFIRGRPIRTAKLSLESAAPTDILLLLQDSAVAVTKLTLVPIFMHPHMTRILQNVPHTLCHLGWDMSIAVSKPDLTLWISALQHLPELRVLEVRATKASDYHAALVRTSSELLPLLQEFTFRDFNENYNRWLRRRDASWERYVSRAE